MARIRWISNAVKNANTTIPAPERNNSNPGVRSIGKNNCKIPANNSPTSARRNAPAHAERFGAIRANTAALNAIVTVAAAAFMSIAGPFENTVRTDNRYGVTVMPDKNGNATNKMMFNGEDRDHHPAVKINASSAIANMACKPLPSKYGAYTIPTNTPARVTPMATVNNAYAWESVDARSAIGWLADEKKFMPSWYP